MLFIYLFILLLVFFLDIIVVFALLSIDFQSSTHLCMQFMCV